MSAAVDHDRWVAVPQTVRFPLELIPPPGFDPEDLGTWPTVAGRLEYVDGRLWFLPPCGDEQQDVVADVVVTLGTWIRQHPGFVLGTNEAGMRIGGVTRAADAAIWRKQDATPRVGGLRVVAPILAVEVAGLGEPEELLRDKASWYFSVGVEVVWLILPKTREVVVLTEHGAQRFSRDQRLSEAPSLPQLTPVAAELFFQLD